MPTATKDLEYQVQKVEIDECLLCNIICKREKIVTDKREKYTPNFERYCEHGVKKLELKEVKS